MVGQAQACSHTGCNRPIKSRGMCNAHYMEAHRRGSLEFRKKGVARAFLEDMVLNAKTDECIVWPFSKSKGYGRIGIGGRMVVVSRFVCEAINGDPPTPEHQAAHLCGNGHLGCVNPKHLQWETQSQNQMDRHAHGTAAIGESAKSAKLSEADVRSILEDGATSLKELAARFSVSYQQVWAIRQRKYWKHVVVDTAA